MTEWMRKVMKSSASSSVYDKKLVLSFCRTCSKQRSAAEGKVNGQALSWITAQAASIAELIDNAHYRLLLASLWEDDLLFGPRTRCFVP